MFNTLRLYFVSFSRPSLAFKSFNFLLTHVCKRYQQFRLCEPCCAFLAQFLPISFSRYVAPMWGEKKKENFYARYFSLVFSSASTRKSPLYSSCSYHITSVEECEYLQWSETVYEKGIKAISLLIALNDIRMREN